MRIFRYLIIMLIPVMLFCSEDKTVNVEDDRAPKTPQNLRTGYVGNGEVTIQWDRNSEPDIAGYKIYRAIGTDTPGGYVLVGDTTANSFTQTGLDYTVIYHYKVSAYDTEGYESELSITLSVAPGNLQPPSVPANLRAVAHNIEYPFIRLVWNANTESDLEGYIIYKSETPNFYITEVLPVDSISTTVYIDETVDINKMYYYRITAYDRGGWEGAPTGVVGDIALPAPALAEPANNAATTSRPTFRFCTQSPRMALPGISWKTTTTI